MTAATRQYLYPEAPQMALVGAKAAEQAAQLAQSLHLPGVRDAHRALLIAAKAAFESALHGAGAVESAVKVGGALDVQRALHGQSAVDVHSTPDQAATPPAWVVSCRESLLRVYCGFAEDARYGVGQLSRAAQRAPSEADCEDGWERVEEIARGAEEVARQALTLASEQESALVSKVADRIQRAARAARATIESRNRAYTFHANPAFSFGEGWYAAAAAVLAGVWLQIEPEQKHTAAAERFLVSAGLGEQLQPYRPRPRANKALPLIVADAFRANPQAAQTRLRAAFLRDAAVAPLVQAWLAARLPAAPARPTVLIWNRLCGHDPHRNSSPEELAALCQIAQEAALCPILIGDGLGVMPLPPGTLDLTLFWKEPLFQGIDMRRAQLELFERLRFNWGLVGQVGVTTAGMDGPALLGLPTLYITDQPNVRLGRWVGTVPDYEEVIRDGTHLAHIHTRLNGWARLQ